MKVNFVRVVSCIDIIQYDILNDCQLTQGVEVIRSSDPGLTFFDINPFLEYNEKNLIFKNLVMMVKITIFQTLY